MSGKELYQAIVNRMLKDAHFVCLTYDSTDANSFRSVDTWHDRVKKANGNRDLEGILVSTKNDLTTLREVSVNEGQEKARKYGLQFFEITCSNYETLEKAFGYLIEKALGD